MVLRGGEEKNHWSGKESLFAVKIRMSWLSTHPFRVILHLQSTPTPTSPCQQGMTQICNSFRSIFATSCCPVFWPQPPNHSKWAQQWQGKDRFWSEISDHWLASPFLMMTKQPTHSGFQRQIPETFLFFAEKLILQRWSWWYGFVLFISPKFRSCKAK